MITETTYSNGQHYSTLRTVFTATHGTEFVLVTFMRPGYATRIEAYQTDEDGIENFLQYINPDLIGVAGAHGLLDAALIVHFSESEKRGITLTPMADWPVSGGA